MLFPDSVTNYAASPAHRSPTQGPLMAICIIIVNHLLSPYFAKDFKCYLIFITPLGSISVSVLERGRLDTLIGREMLPIDC